MRRLVAHRVWHRHNQSAAASAAVTARCSSIPDAAWGSYGPPLSRRRSRDHMIDKTSDEDRLKIALLVTKSGPLVMGTSHDSFTEPRFVNKLQAKGINKFIAYPPP
jgi:hypothetical protein